ncbi:MAG: hypothetical protein VX392_02285 [Verrucomicrobiota bacterium]|nr:hypothetical protein [Verrucomicrobiota bacterium]
MRNAEQHFRDISGSFVIALLLIVTGCGSAPETGGPAGNVGALDQEAAALKSRLATAHSRIKAIRAELGEGDRPIPADGMSVPEIIDELAATNLTAGNRRLARRRMDYLFENLAEQGEQAVPYIREYLNRMEDVDFGIPKSPKDEAKELEYWRSRMVKVPLDFEHPPSLRVGLIDILAEIGGEKAQEAIAEVLITTGRGFEIAYAARKLRLMIGKDAYRDQALGAAHELLTEPIIVNNGNKFDAASRQYLFMVLEMYNDRTFIETAQDQLINEEGRIDRSVLSYFKEIGEGSSIDAVVEAMQSGQLRESDMREMARVAVQGVGQNDARADSLFQDIMTSDEYSLDVKMETIRSMDNSEDLTNMNKEEQANVLQSRLALMDTIQLGDDDIMSWANEIYSGRVEAKIAGRGFDDEKAYETMHADFRKLRDQVNREQRSGVRQQVVPVGPTVVPSP